MILGTDDGNNVGFVAVAGFNDVERVKNPLLVSVTNESSFMVIIVILATTLT